MSTRFYLYGYKRASKSLRAIQKALHLKGFRAIRRDPTNPTNPRNRDIVLVWGTSKSTPWVPNLYINTPTQIQTASNKLEAFKKFAEHNVNCPEFTTNVEEAKTWLANSKVVCRTLLCASGGKGIVLASDEQSMVPAPLYVKYKRKQREYRIHVFKGEVIDAQEKRRILENTTTNPHIRNHANGWVFCRENLVIAPELKQLAIQAVAALQLDFGAVDIIHNTKFNKYYVLEVNTAPGLEGSTINSYINAILQ